MSSMTIQPRAMRIAAQPLVRPLARRRPTAPQAGVRLTRRGRLTLTLVLLAAVMTVLTVFSSGSVATGDVGVAVETRTHVVSEGETLWMLATQIADPGQIREVVYEIQKLNSLPGPSLVEGQELALPVG